MHLPPSPPPGYKRCHSAIALGLLPWFLLSRWYLALESSARPTTSFPSRWPCYSSFRALLRCSNALIFPTAVKHVPTLYRSVLGHTQGDLLSLSHNAGPRPSSSHNRAVEISDLHKERPSMRHDGHHFCQTLLRGSFRERTSSVCFSPLLSPSQRGQLEGLMFRDLSWVSSQPPTFPYKPNKAKAFRG